MRAIGTRAAPLLFEAIVDYPTARRENVATQSGRLFHDLELGSASVDSATFVAQAVAAFDRTVRTRAVASLGDFGEFTRLKQALDSATALGWSAESLAIIQAGMLRDLSGVPFGPGAFLSWTIEEPTVGVEVCNGQGAVACTGLWSVSIRARASGPTGVVTPWSRVNFYVLDPTPTGGDAELLGTVSALVATADAVNTHFDWTLDLGALGRSPGPVRIVAVGIDAAGSPFRTPDFDLVTVVDGT